MLFQRPLIFFTCSECGGATGTTPSTVNVTTSTLYPALTSGASLKLLGVAAAGTAQQYLTGTLPGMVMLTEDGIAVSTDEPALNLPEAVSGEFTRILVATADDPAEWQMLEAPSGNNVIALVDGLVVVTPFSAVPNDALGPDGDFHTPLILVGIRNSSGSTWVSEKLTATEGRVLAGGAGNTVGTLADATFLYHPKIQADTLRALTYEQTDGANGAALTGGIAAGVNDGTNNVLAIYNISSKKFFRAPTRVRENVAWITGGGDVHVGESAYSGLTDGWVDLTPHCVLETTFNYPDAYVDAYIRAQITNLGSDPDDYTMEFGIFVDGGTIAGSIGTPQKIFTIQGSKDNNLNYILKGLSLGSHKIEIKARKHLVVDQTMRIPVSDMSVFSLV